MSATEPNSARLKPLKTAEEDGVRLDRSGWGPGGRRFESCLPDRRKALLKAIIRRLGASAPGVRSGVQYRRDLVRVRRRIWLDRVI